MRQSFTLIELVVSIFIILLTLGGVFSLLVQTIRATSDLPDQLIANYLAQEGIEIVRNIRDANWIEGQEWDAGLTGCNSNCTGCDCSDGCAGSYYNMTLDGYPNVPLHLDGNGYYAQTTIGEETPFKRRIVINPETDSDGNDYLQVRVFVCWQRRGKNYQTELDENLYNWGP